MKKLLLVLYILMVITLSIATLVEHTQGTAFTVRHIYHAPWFLVLWGGLAAGLVGIMWHQKMRFLTSSGLLHTSFIVILAGAFLTYLTGQKGYLHLSPGVSVQSFTEEESKHNCALPFTLQLDSFRIDYYPGTEAARDYRSYLSVDGVSYRVSMNKVLSINGYRFYQSSFDEESEGSWLSVNYDPIGMPITYLGYFLLALSSVWILISPKGGFRELLRNPLLRQGAWCFLLLFLPAISLSAESLPVLSARQADSLARTPVIYQDRVTPLNTLALDFVKKLTGESRYKGLTPEQVIGGWILAPEIWQNEPLIRIKQSLLRERLGMKGEFICFNDLFKDGHYRLQPMWKEIQSGKESHVGGKLDDLAKAILETDEKVGLIVMLRQGELIRPLPDDGSMTPSEVILEAELLYNRIPFNKILFMINLTFGFCSFGVLLWQCVRGKVSRQRGWTALLYLSLSIQLFAYVLRWYIGGRIPLSNGYETMQFLSLCVLFTASLLRRRFRFVLPFGFLLSGFTLLVAHLGQMNPQISPLMPVLLSPWLSLHVSLIMTAYALFGFTAFNAMLALSLPSRLKTDSQESLTLFSRLLLYPAILFLGVGIFIGAIWANESWGRYWAWDPKEVWALITFMVYGVAVHTKHLAAFRNPNFFHIYLLFAFLTVLMTYFGVNYILGGMHSYANN